MLSSVRKPLPCVTGISPKEGPPGTRVTIRGEHLGIDPRDLIGLRICGVDCLLSAEWKSPNKIIARTGQAKGKGDIIVVTRAGGVGTCTVQFKGYVISIGPLQESAVWIDETQSHMMRHRMSAPILLDHDDPLGISDESNDTKFPEQQLFDLFPEGSGDTSAENFEVEWFLLQNHHCTSFDDMKAGLAFLKRKSEERHEGPLAFVKSNLTTFMDCQETLAEMHEKLNSDQSTSTSGNVTRDLQSVLVSANTAAEAMFQDVLKRKDRADATRNALSVLQRFKFLFYLPCTIDRNIKKGDYDLVITDYMRAKSLFGDTEVEVFKKVYKEVENRMKIFRDMLYKKLLDLPTTLEEQKKLIRYLNHLDSPGDPAWECLVNMQEWLLHLFMKCKDEHIAKEKEDLAEMEKEDASLSMMSPRRHLSHSSREPSYKAAPKAPQKVQFVEHLSRILTENLPDFWRLGQSYLSGKLTKSVDGSRRGNKIEPSKHSDFKKMIVGVISMFSNLLRAAFLPDLLAKMSKFDRDKLGLWLVKNQDTPYAWLPICVRHLRSCVASLTSLELPVESTDILQKLAFDLRVSCMKILLNQAMEDIKALHHRETWTVDSNDETGGTTLLPALFENILSETVQHLQEVIQAKQGEMELFNPLQPEIQKQASELCIKLLQAFAGTLDQLAIVGNVERSIKSPRTAMAPDLYASQGDTMPPLDTRLMVMLSNCNHTMNHILPRLTDFLQRHNFPDTERIHEESKKSYQDLDEKLFDSYIEEKAGPVVGMLEQNMYAGRFDWIRCPRPSGVRPYIKQAIMGMIEVHAEVYAICPHFIQRIMSRIVEAVIDEVSRLLQCVEGFGTDGSLQARIELNSLDCVIGIYKSEQTTTSVKEALACIKPMRSNEDKKFLEDELNKFKMQMRFQMMCFQNDQKIRSI